MNKTKRQIPRNVPLISQREEDNKIFKFNLCFTKRREIFSQSLGIIDAFKMLDQKNESG